jgi:putative ABC transport system permease protein
VLGTGIALALRPVFPLPVTIHPGAFFLLVGVAALVGMLASVAALRRVMSVDPALAFSS